MANDQNLKHFSSTHQPAKNGRKPAHLKRFLKENFIGTQDVRDLLGGILINYKTEAELRAALADPKTPPIVLFPLKALLADKLKGRLDAFSLLMRFAYGEPKQEVVRRVAADDPNVMSYDELLQRKREVIQKIARENMDLIKEELQKHEQDNPDKVPGSDDSPD
jgi:hypothetical protein